MTVVTRKKKKKFFTEHSFFFFFFSPNTLKNSFKEADYNLEPKGILSDNQNYIQREQISMNGKKVSHSPRTAVQAGRAQAEIL